jgi:hypothetical protein
MILIKLTKNGQDFTFDMNNKILSLDKINLPIQFENKGLASGYITGYMRDQDFEYGFTFEEIKNEA